MAPQADDSPNMTELRRSPVALPNRASPFPFVIAPVPAASADGRHVSEDKVFPQGRGSRRNRSNPASIRWGRSYEVDLRAGQVHDHFVVWTAVRGKAPRALVERRSGERADAAVGNLVHHQIVTPRCNRLASSPSPDAESTQAGVAPCPDFAQIVSEPSEVEHHRTLCGVPRQHEVAGPQIPIDGRRQRRCVR